MIIDHSVTELQTAAICTLYAVTYSVIKYNKAVILHTHYA
jgi:hypothetical protein